MRNPFDTAPAGQTDTAVDDEEPRWLAVIALVAVGALFTVLPEAFTVGPNWLLLAVVAVLLIPTIIAHKKEYHALNRALGLTVAGVVTAAMVASVLSLVHAIAVHSLTHHRPLDPDKLLRAALILWLTNVLVFALWYWHLDAGGPHQRDLQGEHAQGAFLFPQTMMDPAVKAAFGQMDWRPGFIDYLFLAFNTSTALSPTDTAVLTRWAKTMMMIQSLISLTIIALLAARAVNIL